MNTIYKITVGLALLLVSCKEGKKEERASLSGKGISIKEVRLKDLNGQAIDPENYKGRTIFLNVWATWCKPCKEEMPSIGRAQKILLDENIVFLMASGETAEEINGFKTSNDYPFNYTQIENSEELGILALPTTFIFDASGTLVFSEMGSRQWDEDENIDLIRKIINKNE